MFVNLLAVVIRPFVTADCCSPPLALRCNVSWWQCSQTCSVCNICFANYLFIKEMLATVAMFEDELKDNGSMYVNCPGATLLLQVSKAFSFRQQFTTTAFTKAMVDIRFWIVGDNNHDSFGDRFFFPTPSTLLYLGELFCYYLYPPCTALHLKLSD